MRALGERINHIEIGQAAIIGRLDTFAAQLSSACGKLDHLADRVDDHETRIRLRETAYQERILPALERLHNLEIKVAGGAFVGGALIAGIVEIVRLLAG